MSDSPHPEPQPQAPALDPDEVRRRVAKRVAERAGEKAAPSRKRPIPEDAPGFIWNRPATQCKAARRMDGYRCQNPAIPGGTVCRFHGGNSPGTRNAARLRLLDTVDAAIATLAREMVQAEKSADRQRAANSLLDRAGVSRINVVESEDALSALSHAIQEVIPMGDQNTVNDSSQSTKETGNA